MLEFKVLGPLEVVHDDGSIVLGGQKQRALLALLLIHAREVLSTDRIIGELWGEQPPQKPVVVDVTVREVQPYQFRYGASYDTEGQLGGVLDASAHNVLGKARVVGLSARYDSQLTDGRIFLSQPTLLHWPIQTTASVYYRDERNPPTETTEPFNIDRRGVSIQQERKLKNAYVWTYGYRFERARTFELALRFLSESAGTSASLASRLARLVGGRYALTSYREAIAAAIDTGRAGWAKTVFDMRRETT